MLDRIGIRSSRSLMSFPVSPRKAFGKYSGLVCGRNRDKHLQIHAYMVMCLMGTPKKLRKKGAGWAWLHTLAVLELSKLRLEDLEFQASIHSETLFQNNGWRF